MSEVKVGEYARINKDFRITCLGIGKVVNKNQNTIYIKMSSNDLPIAFNVDSIVKHGQNIIDLIEIKDFIEVRIGDEVVSKFLIQDEQQLESTRVYVREGSMKIIAVVTHEQFKNIEYRVGE